MPYQISPMDEADAMAIIHWKYEPPYHIYNLDGDKNEVRAMLNEWHYAVHTPGQGLVGFYCYGQSAQVPGGRLRGYYLGRKNLDIGLGLRPDLTGQGLGESFMRAGMSFAIDKWQPKALRLTVACDNPRAIAVYKRLGFEISGRLTARAHYGWQDYYIMRLPLTPGIGERLRGIIN